MQVWWPRQGSKNSNGGGTHEARMGITGTGTLELLHLLASASHRPPIADRPCRASERKRVRARERTKAKQSDREREGANERERERERELAHASERARERERESE